MHELGLKSTKLGDKGVKNLTSFMTLNTQIRKLLYYVNLRYFQYFELTLGKTFCPNVP